MEIDKFKAAEPLMAELRKWNNLLLAFSKPNSLTINNGHGANETQLYIHSFDNGFKELAEDVRKYIEKQIEAVNVKIEKI